jgi:hypothetical protein
LTQPSRVRAPRRTSKCSHRQETALHEAVRFEDGKTLDYNDRALLDAGTIKGKEEEIIKYINKDRSPKMVKLLMDADTQLANFPAGGISPMYLAILLGKDTIAVTLYVKSCGNLSYCGPDGQNALHIAVLRATNAGTPKCIYLLWQESYIHIAYPKYMHSFLLLSAHRFVPRTNKITFLQTIFSI